MNFINSIFFIFLSLFLLNIYETRGQTARAVPDSVLAVEYLMQAVESGMNNEPAKSLEFFRKSLEYRKKIFGEKHYRLGSTYMGMAIQYKNLYQLENAYRYFRIAEEMYLFNASENDPRLADVYTNIGNYYRSKGNYAEALRYHERAMLIYQASKESDNQNNYLKVIYNMAEALNLANREAEALQLISDHYKSAPFDLKNSYLNLMASSYQSLLKADQAKSILESLIISIEKEYGPEDYDLADQFVNYAQFLNNNGLQDSALLYLGKAEKIYLLYENTYSDLSELYISMAESWRRKHVQSVSYDDFQKVKTVNLEKSVHFYLKALNLLNDSAEAGKFALPLFENSNFPIASLRILNDLGQTWQQMAGLQKDDDSEIRKKYLTLSLNTFTTASDLALHMRTGFVSEESKLLFAGLQRNIFSRTIGVAFDLHQISRDAGYFDIALENTGRAKSASLFDNIAESQAREVSFIPDSLTELENLLNSNLAYYREKLYEEEHNTEPDSVKIRDYRQQIFSNEQQRNDLRAFLEQNFSEYYDFKYKREALTLRKIQRSLKRNESLVEYFVNNEVLNSEAGNIFILAVDKHGYQFKKAGMTPELNHHIGVVHQMLSSTGFLNSGLSDFRNYCQAAYQLYRELLQPVHSTINRKRLTIIPDGILSYIPFEALLISMPQTDHIHYHDLSYLIHDFPVNYSYSTELLLTSGKKEILSRKKTIAFAPDYSEARYHSDDTQQLASIPGIFDEVGYLETALRADAFTGRKATESNFRENAGLFDILHLAMHTLINDSLPAFSRLAFFPVDHDNIRDDGWFTTSDIYNLNLNARLAVLSACNTGTGILRRGEGVMSLARGFLYAGCPTVVMTLWEVEDRSGTMIMKEFYRNLKSGKPIDVALRNAKLAHIRNADPLMSHPHFWLGYISIGDTDPLFSGNEYYFFGTLLLIAILLIIDQWKKKLARK